MVGIALLYWLAASVVLYPYLAYPALLAWRARHRSRPVRRGVESLPSVTVVLAVRNEAKHVRRRLAEFAGRIAAEGLGGEIVIVSDGSTDGTEEVARRFADAGAGGPVPVIVVGLASSVGKAAALNAGVREASGDVLALADARQTWAPDALRRLLENFADPEVGAVSGELVVESSPGVMSGVGLYWKVEKWLRRREAAVHSTAGLTGAVCAVRRGLFRPIPSGTVLDDVYWPLRVVMQGYRVVFDDRAIAYDRLPERVGAEFRRKVRTLAGNYQLAARLPEALAPWRNPVWTVVWSHKLARLAVPWALIATAGCSFALGGPLYTPLFATQLGATLVALAGLIPAVATRSRLAAAAGSFLMLNAAAWVAFWVWATGGVETSWTRTTYRAAVSPELERVAS